jgi:hypothetical protein
MPQKRSQAKSFISLAVNYDLHVIHRSVERGVRFSGGDSNSEDAVELQCERGDLLAEGLEEGVVTRVYSVRNNTVQIAIVQQRFRRISFSDAAERNPHGEIQFQRLGNMVFVGQKPDTRMKLHPSEGYAVLSRHEGMVL